MMKTHTNHAEPIPFEEVVSFHGHACPGLAIGYRVAQAAMRRLRSGRSGDEEFVAIVENDACGVDAVEYICGCTFGKGNLVFRDHGKQAFTFYNRKPATRMLSVDPAGRSRLLTSHILVLHGFL